MDPSDRRVRMANGSPGFSLVELLVVIVIIVIVIALVIPALGGARDVAKLASTNSMIKELGNAVDRFRQDKGGLSPGYFDQVLMGDAENAGTHGFSNAENVVIDLAGGTVEDNSGPGQGNGAGDGDFGPTSAEIQRLRDEGILLRVDLIGADYPGNPGYYMPKDKFFVAQSRPDSQFGTSSDAANIPDLVDAWGNPLLVWVEDDLGPDVAQLEDFARLDSSSGEGARFYWASNAAFLRATELGDGGKNQTTGSRGARSLLGDGVNATQIERTMAGLLGNLNYPNQEELPDTAAVAIEDILPTSARGGVIVHSAGADGIYLSNTDRDAKQLDADSKGLLYGHSFYNTGSNRWKADGAPTVNEVTEKFDDVIITFGN